MTNYVYFLYHSILICEQIKLVWNFFAVHMSSTDVTKDLEIWTHAMLRAVGHRFVNATGPSQDVREGGSEERRRV